MGKCVALPKLPELTLPAGLSLSPPDLPLPAFPADVCCKLPPLPKPDLPVHIPPIALAPVLAVLKAATKAIGKVLQYAPLTCPRE